MTRTETTALAGRILDFERLDTSMTSPLEPVLRACEKLRGALSKFMGTQGYDALLKRALTRANVKAPLLGYLSERHSSISEQRVQEADIGTRLESDAASVNLIGEILGLLFIFIGAPLTHTLIEGVWPDIFRPASSNETKGGT